MKTGCWMSQVMLALPESLECALSAVWIKSLLSPTLPLPRDLPPSTESGNCRAQVDICKLLLYDVGREPEVFISSLASALALHALHFGEGTHGLVQLAPPFLTTGFFTSKVVDQVLLAFPPLTGCQRTLWPSHSQAPGLPPQL